MAKSVLSFILLLLFTAYALKVIPQDMKVTFINDKYINDANANIRRFSRNGDYYLNMWGTILHTWTNNLTVTIVITEFLQNEYRWSFIEFHYKFCDLVKKEPMFGKMLKLKGVVCPAPKGRYSLYNMTVQSHNFPNVWPFEKGGFDITVTVTDTGEQILEAYVPRSKREKVKLTFVIG